MVQREEPIGPETVAEFDFLITQLDIQLIGRIGWDRLKAILLTATLSAGDTEKGQLAYDKAVAKWRRSIRFDGRD